MASDPNARRARAGAVSQLARAYLDDGGGAARARFVASLRTWSFDAPNATVERALAVLAANPDADHQRLVDPAVRRTLASLVAPATADAGVRLERFEPDALVRSLDHPLNHRILADHIFASPEIEQIITLLRAHWLEMVLSRRRPAATDQLLAAVALQMQTTQWIYPEAPAESSGVETLAGQLADRSVALPAGLVYAMYRPLTSVPSTRALLVGVDCTEVGTLLRRHFDEPQQERELASSIPQLTAITDRTSRVVAEQYEERPYPQWRHMARPTSRTVGEAIAGAIADPALAGSIDFVQPEILIAGCGTGRHAMATALRHPSASVTALDLSLPSLAYAARQADNLGISNVAFIRADLVELAGWDRTFDVVESVGVLHHLEDPEQGWATLHSLTRPGGLMKLGLYSARGRSLLDPVSRIIEQGGLRPDSEGIQEVRDFVRTRPHSTPLGRLARTPDFYSLAGCRDLFFHAHEDRFDIRRIQRALEMLQLEFLGFELPSRRVRQMYVHAFPGDPHGRNLDNWDAFERANPLLFVAMYRFWVRARPDRAAP